MRVVGLRATNVGDGLHVRLEWAITGASTFDYSVVETYDRYKQRWVPFDGFNGVVQRQKTAIDDNPPQSIVVAARQPLPGTASFRVCARRRVGDTIISTPWEQVAVDVFLDLITEDRIADGAISGDKIAPGTITGDHIRAGSIKAEHLDAVSIIVDQLEAGSITSEYIAAEAIEAHHIAAQAIEARHISAEAIQSNHIAANAIQAWHIAAGSIEADHIASGAITADHIQAGTITAESGIIASLSADVITTGTLNADRVSVNASAGGAGVGLRINSAGMTLTRDNLRIVRLDADGIRISYDGGKTWTTKLTGEGLNVTSADIGHAQINTAHISELDASVIKSGVIDSRLVTIGSPAMGPIDFEHSEFRMELGPNGLIIRDTDIVTDTTRMIWLSSEGLKISKDGGQTWTTKLTGDGLSVTTADLSEVKITSAMIEEAAIRDAHIYDVSADKLRAGTINTGTITVKSTLQVTDQDDQVRVVLGDYSSIFDNPPGTNYGLVIADPEKGILIDAEGVHTEGILDAAIVTEKLAPGAVTDEKIRDVSADKITVGTLDANRVTIAAQAGGVGNRFIIDRLGLTVQNADLGSETDKTKMIRIDSDGLKVSRDGGRTWVTKITGDGLQVTSADIGEAQITSAHILELDASLIKSGYIDAARIAAASITADKLVLGKIPHAINPATDHLFPFDHDLFSTQGMEPAYSERVTLKEGKGFSGGAVELDAPPTELTFVAKTKQDWLNGTLTNLTATDDGTLMLAKSGQDFAYDADWHAGEITGLVIDSEGNLSLEHGESVIFTEASFEEFSKGELAHVVPGDDLTLALTGEHLTESHEDEHSWSQGEMNWVALEDDTISLFRGERVSVVEAAKEDWEAGELNRVVATDESDLVLEHGADVGATESGTVAWETGESTNLDIVDGDLALYKGQNLAYTESADEDWSSGQLAGATAADGLRLERYPGLSHTELTEADWLSGHLDGLVSTSTANLIDFEDGINPLRNHDPDATASMSIVSSPTHGGAKALERSVTGSGQTHRAATLSISADRYSNPWIEAWVYPKSGWSTSPFCGVVLLLQPVQANQYFDGYFAFVDARNGTGSTSAFQLRKGGEQNDVLASDASIRIDEDTWYRVRLEINGDVITARLWNSNGELLSTLSATDTTYVSGEFGIANIDPAVFDDISYGTSAQDTPALELWQPDVYGAFDNDLRLRRKDGTFVEPLSGHVATLRPGEGRFGGAVAVEEETTNLIANPSFENNLTSWGNWGSPSVREVITSDAYHGSRALRIVTTGNNQGVEQAVSLTDGATYTLSCYVKVLSGRAVLMTGAGGIYLETETPPEWTGDGKWHRFSLTFTANNTSYIWIGKSSGGAVGEYLFDAVQLEAKPFATSFVDGTRAGGILEYPGSVLSLDEATLVCWIKPHPGSPDKRLDIWATNTAQSSQDRLILGRNITGDGWGFHFRPAGATSQELRSNVPMDYNWHMLGFRYKYNPSTDRYDLALIFDGQIVATGTSSTPGRLTNISRLYSDGGNTYAANCLIDELLILPYAASDEEIRSWYVMDAPFYDPSRVIMGTTIADGAITARHIRAQSITGDHIRAGAITAESGIIASLNADVITGGTLNVGELRAIVSPFGGDDAHPRFRLDSSGLQIQDSTGQKMIRLDDDGLKLSTDGGQTWDLRITGDGIVVDWADIRNVNITHAQIQSIDATKITVNKIKGSQIEANSITSSHIQAGAIKADQLDASGLIAKISSIQQAFINDAHITSLRADKISGGYLSASVIRAGSITGAHLAANSITTDKLAVGSKANLVNNFSMTGTLTGWSGYGSGTLVDEVTKGGVTVKTLKITTTGNVQVQSEVFEVDPTKTYEVTLSIYSNHPDNTGTRYFGLHCYDANMNNIGAIPFTISSRTFGSSPNTNPYFWNGDVYGGQWRDMTAYILGCNVDASEVPLGKNVTYHYKMLPNTKYVRIRFLNYYNEGVSVTNHFFSPSVSLAPATLISADSISTGTLLASKVQILSGSATGNRIVLDGAGLRAYGSEGETVNISSSDGNVYLRGSIRANQFILPVRAT